MERKLLGKHGAALIIITVMVIAVLKMCIRDRSCIVEIAYVSVFVRKHFTDCRAVNQELSLIHI